MKQFERSSLKKRQKDRRTPKRGRALERTNSSARFWSAAVLLPLWNDNSSLPESFRENDRFSHICIHPAMDKARLNLERFFGNLERSSSLLSAAGRERHSRAPAA